MSAFAITFLKTAWACEDAFIDFRVVENALRGHGLTWNPGERVWNFTSPLWTLVLIPVSGLLGSEYLAAMLVSFACSVGSFVLLCRLAGRASVAATASVLLLCSASAMDWSSGGLETPLLQLLALSLLTFTAGVVDGKQAWAHPWLGLCCCAGLAALARLDAVLMAVPCGLIALVSLRSRIGGTADRVRLLLLSAIGLLPLLAWELFALVYFGDVVPNTAHAKLPVNHDWTEFIRFGAHYYVATMIWDPAVAISLVLAAVGGIVWSRRWGALVWLAVVLSTAYTLAVGADYMAGRFTSPWLYLIVGGLALALRDRLAIGGRFPRVTVATALALSCLAWLVLRIGKGTWDATYYIQRDSTRFEVADERAFYFRNTGLLHVLEVGGVDHRWVRAAHAQLPKLRKPVVLAKCNIGMYGWAVGDSAQIVDMLALSEPFLALLPACPSSRPGHFRRLFPTGFFGSEVDGRSHLVDPTLARLWSDTERISRGPLFDAERWRAIVRVRGGFYTQAALAHGLEAGNEDFPPRTGRVSPITCDTPILTDGGETYSLHMGPHGRLEGSMLR